MNAQKKAQQQKLNNKEEATKFRSKTKRMSRKI